MYSFSMKLFLGFWFIALTAILGTRFISVKLLEDNFAITIVEETNLKDTQKLQRFKQQLSHRGHVKISAFLKNNKSLHHDNNLWLKADKTNAPVHNTLPLPPKQQESITTYINNNLDSKIQTVLINHTRLTGPLLVTIDKQSYQAYFSQRQSKRRFSQLLTELPVWLRLAVTITISFILSWLLARSFSKPVLAMKEATAALAKGNLSTRVHALTSRKDELGELAQSFNQMAEQLESNLSAQQRLLGDVSHELRSPLTRLHMALALVDENNDNEVKRQQYIQRCQLEVSRIDEMLAEILVLSRLENTVQALQRERFDFILLLRNIIKDAQFIADEKEVLIELCLSKINPNKNITISADSALLTSAISNVLTNAIKYSVIGGKIKVGIAVLTNQRQPLLSLNISDQGPGVPEQAIKQLFNAFYRVNSARDRQTGGTGLGLAIAKQAVIAHSGTISAKNINNNNTNKNHGLIINIKLPL
jgi:two-component system sensor histidine kinase CpxA